VQRLSTLCHFATPRAATHVSRLPGGTLRSRRQKGREWAWQLLSTLWHGGECIVWRNWPLVWLPRLRDRNAVRRPAAKRFVRDAQSAVRLPESRSRLRLDRLTSSRTALSASWANGLAAGRRTASVSQPRQTHSSSLTPYNAFVAVS